MSLREKIANYFDTDVTNITILDSFYNLNSDGWMEEFWTVSYLNERYVFDYTGWMVYKEED